MNFSRKLHVITPEKSYPKKGEANPAYSIGFACVPKDLRDGVR